MNKKLRLLITKECPNKCSKCCNIGRDFTHLPVVDRWDYEEIMLTGGEPLLYPLSVISICTGIRIIHKAMGINCKIFVYTAIADIEPFLTVLELVDGIVYTPHRKEDIEDFIKLNHKLLQDPSVTEDKSMRLNLFADMKALIPDGTDLSKWQVKDMEWIDNCPVPDGEDFRRVTHLMSNIYNL